MAKWLDNAIFYEIYPQSFLDTNGDGIGDFQGIIEKLDYIKELGCNAIWMNPCFHHLHLFHLKDLQTFRTLLSPPKNIIFS